ncbi:MAG: hypothetical protein AB7G24_00840 [Novosphingobium sp.]
MIETGDRVGADRVIWTYVDVKAALVECAVLWLRSPGGGRWPFAADGPWCLIQREAWEYDARGGDGASADVPIRPLPLTRDQVALRDERSEWLLLIEDDADRRLVEMALIYLAKGRANVPWAKVKRRMGLRFGVAGLKKRFAASLSAICKSLNAAEMRR